MVNYESQTSISSKIPNCDLKKKKKNRTLKDALHVFVVPFLSD